MRKERSLEGRSLPTEPHKQLPCFAAYLDTPRRHREGPRANMRAASSMLAGLSVGLVLPGAGCSRLPVSMPFWED